MISVKQLILTNIMTVDELASKHYDIFENRLIGNPDAKHTKLSIEFTVGILRNLNIGRCHECDADNEINNKIQELKQYLDEDKV